jgi:hypothetical protein
MVGVKVAAPFPSYPFHLLIAVVIGLPKWHGQASFRVCDRADLVSNSGCVEQTQPDGSSGPKNCSERISLVPCPGYAA